MPHLASSTADSVSARGLKSLVAVALPRPALDNVRPDALDGPAARQLPDGLYQQVVGKQAPVGARMRGDVFRRAPQSVAGFLAAVLEPGVAALALLATALVQTGGIDTHVLTLCFLTLILAFPGVDRFGQGLSAHCVGIGGSWALLMCILLGLGYGTSTLHLIPGNLLVAWAVLTPVLQVVANQLAERGVRWYAAQPASRRRAVVIGAGPLGVKVAHAIPMGRAKEDFLGFFDDRLDERLHPDARSRRLGNFGEVADYVRTHGVKEVFITLPLGSQPRIITLLKQLQGTTASIYFVPDVFGISIIQGRLQDVNGVPVVGICETPFTGINRLTKRLSDIMLSLLILLLISPVMLAVAIGVKLSSPGPVIFRQKRNGLDGEEIVVYKFRSMTTMDNGPVVKQATKGDTRITPFGAFIRKTSLDELPQFFNVMQGRMSIVGPRPHAVAHNEMYRQMIKAYMVRHKVKPGITGWAQVNGHRGETDTLEKMEARVEYDLEYLRNWSLGLDLAIILRTVGSVLADNNAY